MYPPTIVNQVLQKNVVHKITLKQLGVYNSAPFNTREHLVKASGFLLNEIPTRLAKTNLQFYRSEVGAFSTNLAVVRFRTELENAIEKLVMCKDATSLETSKKASQIKKQLDNNLESLMGGIKEWSSVQEKADYKDMGRFLNYVNYSMIGVRVLFDQHEFLVGQLNGGADLKKPIVSMRANVGQIARIAINDVSSLCTEKYGRAPEVLLVGDTDSEMICVESHLHFMFVETLKNSMQALIGRQEKVNWDEIPPIVVRIVSATSRDELSICVEDQGGGFSFKSAPTLFRYFFTTSVASVPTYTYSGNFGVPFKGLGCGIPLTTLYTKYMGGTLSVCPLLDFGNKTFIYLNKSGTETVDIEDLD